tara:strand:+ start:1002 stop:1202 length:201 start_codon:yes stop_codon:yes gene_type:complete
MIREALTKKLEGEVAVLTANITTFLDNPTIAIPDHIDYVGTLEKELEKLSTVEGKLATLKRIKTTE